MNLRFAGFLLAIPLMTTPCFATVSDGKPWDWNDYRSMLQSTASFGSDCENISKNIGNPDLKCEIDHASWDQFMNTEMQKKFKDRTTDKSPWDCGNGAMNFFRNYTDGGHIPGSTNNEAGPVDEEMKTKLGTLRCTMEETDKDQYLTYDKGSRTLTFHLTMKPLYNSAWVGYELQKMKEDFPVINKYWDDGHNM